MNYEEKYKQALEMAKEELKVCGSQDCDAARQIFRFFPELKKSDDERIRKEIIGFLKDFEKDHYRSVNFNSWIAWLEKQKDYIKLPNSTYTSNKDVIEFADKYSHDVWEKLMDNFKKIENYHIGCNDVSDIVLNAIINTYNWLEKQGQTFTKKDVDDAYLQGICDTKHAIEKQGESPRTNIEIPFGASDSELQEVSYYIPEGFYAEIKDDRVVIKKVESKVKVGDWVMFNGTVAQILDKQKYGFAGLDIDGKDFFCNYGHTDSMRLWTINDAKDGDVLVNGSNIFIFHFINDTRLMGYCHVNLNDGRFYDDIGRNECFCLIDAVVTPAIKEQQDLLFKEMKNAGYAWDSEKKRIAKDLGL